jgi:hypothetical protein
MATSQQTISPSKLYADFMAEIKTRMNVIGDIQRHLATKQKAPADFVHAETCFLQVRFICELIALSAAAAHQTAGLTKDILKSWHADRSLGYLSEINPHCFPMPVKMSIQEDGMKHFEVLDGGLERDGLREIYNACGEILHRGSLKHALNQRERVYDLRKLNEWTRSIGTLLAEHTVIVLSEDMVLMVQLDGPQGKVQVITAVADGPSVFEPPNS